MSSHENPVYCAACEQIVEAPCSSVDCSTPDLPAQPVPAWIDEKALEIARRFTQDTEPQRRAALQCAVVEAVLLAVPTNGRMPVQLGPKLFSFHSFEDWCNTAQRQWRKHKVNASHTLCIDQHGRVLGWGKHFMTAREDRAFPVDVYLLRADMGEVAP